ITLDNFGAGSFSLRYFKFFPLSALKIDKSFVQDCLTNYRSAAIIEAAVSLARAIGVTAIAEGVETARQADFLRGCRCDIIQGYYISYPAAPDVTAAFLRSHKS
ncbi:MAG TPA: EAL domain-containing protein, partial [Smithellaceae bacterium]|nr:EAL domain-containing protein [Smithellaceae bacterium]